MIKSYQTKILNNHYAPGIATYGINGKDGERGEQGSAFYFTTYNLEYNSSEKNEMNDVLVKLNQNKVLSVYVDREIERKYITGDIIIDSRGFMYRVYEDNGNFKLQYISQISINDSLSYFELSGDRVVMTESGLDLADDYNSISTNTSSFPLRIFSSKVSSELDRNEILALRCKDYDGNEKYMNVYFDKNSESFHFVSSSPIVFDTSTLLVNQTDESQNFSDYYKIEPYKSPLGLLHKKYADVYYSISENNLIITGLDFSNLVSNIDLVPEFVKVYAYDNNKLVGEYCFVVDKSSENFNFELPNEILGYSLRVSLIKGVEIFISENN